VDPTRNRSDGGTAVRPAWSITSCNTYHHARLAGTAIRRIGYECWLRNIAVALGNAPRSKRVMQALESRRGHASAVVREHVEWAIAQQQGDHGQ
jgi:epoxyqueuosine reductase QueG